MNYLTPPQLAKRLNVSPDTIRRRIKAGKITTSTIAGQTAISEKEVNRLITEAKKAHIKAEVGKNE